jgi:hypothetical protein
MMELANTSDRDLRARDPAGASFNLFRRKEVPELLCAVPEDRIVPHFIAGESWEFGGKISGDSHHQPGFDGSAASASARYNGYYLFQSWTPCDPVPEQAATVETA